MHTNHVDIVADALPAVKERTQEEKRSTIEIPSKCAGEDLSHRHRASEVTVPESFYGFEPLLARGMEVSNELIDKLLEEDNE